MNLDSLIDSDGHDMERFGTYWDGEVVVDTEAHEARNSCWVNAPRLAEASTDRTIFDLRGTSWDLMSVVASDGALLLELRKFPGDRPPLVLAVQRDGRILHLGSVQLATEDLQSALDRALLA